MNILDEILAWSTAIPGWQRDALRRLIVQGSLGNDDIAALTEQCKGAHGLVPKLASEPLEKKHLPTKDSASSVTTLTSITHHAGVNALASEQTIEFGPGLTIVYGDNAAGKSGYTRVLKRACRARGAEEILGNVLSGGAPGRPSATIRFRVGDDDESLAWIDQDIQEHHLGNISVFDSHCAAVYLREKTDVAFRPFALDLFDKLSTACEGVRAALDKERAQLKTPAPLPVLTSGTATYELVSHITSLTNPEEVKKLGALSEEDEQRRVALATQVKDMEADDPARTAKNLTLRAQRLASLGAHLQRTTETLADTAISSIFNAREKVEAARNAARDLHDTTFTPDLLPGSGSDRWRALWEAARAYSAEEAHPGQEFPVTTQGARCLLCQQELQPPSSDRLSGFESFIRSTLQQDVENEQTAHANLVKNVRSLQVIDDVTKDAIDELRLDNEELATSIAEQLPRAEERHTRVLSALTGDAPSPDPLTEIDLQPTQVLEHAETLRKRASELLAQKGKTAKDSIKQEFRELEDRVALGRSIDAVVEEIERKKKLAAYELCRKDTSTRGITRKSSEVTKAVVTQRLASSFQDELQKLSFSHLEVELHEAGGARGALYHKLVFKRASGVDLPRIVSEGEARTLSIAAFFAELSTSSHNSAILFDDPVSSLDHNWRGNVARRLAEEARSRQVVVFTHDIAFLIALVESAEKAGSACTHQYLQREPVLGAGMALPDLPWIAMNVKARIGVLKNRAQKADKLFRTAPREEYENEAIQIYNLLRKAWERGVEEVMLGGVVERYRRSIQTQKAKTLHDIEVGDCEALEAGMTKSSRWLHDQPPEENVPVPDPPELRADIEALEDWVGTFRQRGR